MNYAHAQKLQNDLLEIKVRLDAEENYDAVVDAVVAAREDMEAVFTEVPDHVKELWEEIAAGVSDLEEALRESDAHALSLLEEIIVKIDRYINLKAKGYT